MAKKIFYPKEHGIENSSESSLIGIDDQNNKLKAFCQFVWSDNWQRQSKKLHFMPTILLYGPPGTGKTSLLKNLANSLSSSDLKYYRESLDLLVDKELGETSKAIKDLFDEMIEQTQCGKNVFLQLDDIDSVLSSRFMGNESSGVRRGVNTFLTQMDNLLEMDLDNPPIIATTTNMFSHLDSAIKRRFSLKIEVDPILSEQDIIQILSPMEDVIKNNSQMNYKELGKIVKERQLTPYDVILVMQKLFLSSLTGNVFDSQLLIDELKACESSKISFEQQRQVFSTM